MADMLSKLKAANAFKAAGLSAAPASSDAGVAAKPWERAFDPVESQPSACASVAPACVPPPVQTDFGAGRRALPGRQASSKALGAMGPTTVGRQPLASSPSRSPSKGKKKKKSPGGRSSSPAKSKAVSPGFGAASSSFHGGASIAPLHKRRVSMSDLLQDGPAGAAESPPLERFEWLTDDLDAREDRWNFGSFGESAGFSLPISTQGRNKVLMDNGLVRRAARSGAAPPAPGA